MNKNFKKSLFVFVLLALAGASFLGWAKYNTLFIIEAISPVAVDSVVAYKIDTAKVALLKRVYSKLNLNKKEFLIAGRIGAKNGADSTDRLTNADYVFSRKGTSFYFKLGATESFNANGFYLYVDHGMKKVLLSKEKQIASDFLMPELSSILNTVAEEGFKLNSMVNGENQRISLTNPYHLSCKEYSVTFNKLTLKPNRLFVRLSNPQEPEDGSKDNVIDFRIRLSSAISNIQKYTTQNIVIKGNKSWSLGPAFRSYELINTL